MDITNSIGYSISKEEIENDVNLVILANKMRLLLPTSPSQSFFRVYALIIISINNDSETLIIHGTNSEASYIGSSICAERSALVKLRYFNNPKILKVIIVTDLNYPVAPGNLYHHHHHYNPHYNHHYHHHYYNHHIIIIIIIFIITIIIIIVIIIVHKVCYVENI